MERAEIPMNPVVFSFDVEEHHRIEAAAGLQCPPERRHEYGERMAAGTRWIAGAWPRRAHRLQRGDRHLELEH